jgi:membrane-associated protease RseP (regulator of RpoE activity)
MITDHDLAQLDSIVREYFEIQNITYGGPKQPFISRYQAIPKSEVRMSFSGILEKISPMRLSAVIRREHGDIVLFLMPASKKKKIFNPVLNLIMFILTLLSVLITGGLYGFQGTLPNGFWQTIMKLIQSGWPFAVSLLTILGAHEFGHYFAGLKNGVDVTLPFFIPFPLSLFGTMGAFINMRSVPKDKRALFDLAVTGPLSGALVSMIVLVIGLMLSEVSPIPAEPIAGSTLQMEGNSILYLLTKYAVFGETLPRPPGLDGIPLIAFWFRYFFTGEPFPWGAMDVMLHPVAWAGWAGFLVTGINLIPAGQLDGGHIFFTLFGRKAAQRVLPFIVGILAAMGVFWNGWWLWAGLIFLLGRRSAETLDQVTELDSKRRIIGYIALALFVLTFIPVPITIPGL